jgi:hypothetical protein
MKSGRTQFTLGSLMILIAILAVAFTYPFFSVNLLIGAVGPIALMAVLTALHYLVMTPCLRLVGAIEGWLDAKARARRPTGREP